MPNLTTRARCLNRDCAWHEEGPDADIAARRHSRETGHPTATVTEASR